MKPQLLFSGALGAIILLSGTANVWAQTTDARPLQELFQTETVYPQEKGEIQFTFSSKFNKSAERKLFETPVAVEYGLSDRWQVSLRMVRDESTNNCGGKNRGVGDLQIGTKYSWMNIGRSNFHAAVGFELGVPTGSVGKGLGEGNLEYQPYVVVAKDFPRLSRLQIFSQFGVCFAQHVRGQSQLMTMRPGSRSNGITVCLFAIAKCASSASSTRARALPKTVSISLPAWFGNFHAIWNLASACLSASREIPIASELS